jgi:hypothetical protein
LLRKARFVPIPDLPYYGTRFIANRLRPKIFSRQRLPHWGPRIEEMNRPYMPQSLEWVASLQWKRCVDAAHRAFQSMEDRRHIKIKYEDFVQAPFEEMTRIASFIGLEDNKRAFRSAVRDVHPWSVGKGFESLGSNRIRAIEPLIRETLQQHGYTRNVQ